LSQFESLKGMENSGRLITADYSPLRRLVSVRYRFRKCHQRISRLSSSSSVDGTPFEGKGRQLWSATVSMA
jgi:hypothetical protein